MFPFRKKHTGFPVSVSMGMHVYVSKVRLVYRIMLSLIALAGIMGSILSFTAASENLLHISYAAAVIPALISWAVFSAVFALHEKKPLISQTMLLSLGALILLYGLINLEKLSAGYMFAVNDFLGGLYTKYAEAPPFDAGEEFAEIRQNCIDTAMGFTSVIISLLACRTVKKPNIMLFLLATVPLTEITLYFGLVPNYAAFALFIAAVCGITAAELTVFGTFADPSAEKIFTKTAAQSAAAAGLTMLLCFAAACIYMNASGYSRPDKADEFRDGFTSYMKNFTWEKFAEDIHEALIPVKTKEIIHDGRLGNTESVKFTGENVLEVTLPSDSQELYLKGLTAVNYTGSRWSAGPPVPQLETKLTSPEFFTGRALRYTEGLENIEVSDVIVRSSDRTDTTKYYPQFGAGLLETDGIRRRYGVYFPQSLAAYDNGRNIIDGISEIKLSETMASDEAKMRAYAYSSCLSVPETFTAAEDFFSDFDGTSRWEILEYIRKKLGSEYEYTLESGRKPFGSDFAQWFMTSNKKGSCTHFASAAVLLCRYMGIPARYCEGFVIKGSDIAMFPSEGRYTTVSVPDSRAHAWAEIYADGFGWLIFEATPGYGNMAFSSDAEDYSDSVNVSEITSVTTKPPVFTEDPDRMAAEEVSFSGVSEEEVSQAENGTETAYESEITVTASTADSSDSELTAESENHSNAENGGNSGSGSENSNISKGTGDNGDGNGRNTDVPGSEQTGEGSIESEYDENGLGIDTPPVSEASDTQKEHTSDSKKNMPKEIKILLTVIICIAAAAGIYFLLRKAETSRRKALIRNRPQKAAAEIYRLLERLSRMAGIEEKNEELGRILTEDCGAESGKELVACALKARFGNGVSAEDVFKAAENYQIAANIITKLLSESKMIAARLMMMDKYV